MEQLTFTKQQTAYVCQLSENQRGGVVQVTQRQRGNLSVTANLPGMPPAVIAVLNNPYSTTHIFSLDLPDGLEVTIKSSTEVDRALWSE